MLKSFNKYFSISKLERKILNQTFYWLIFATILARLVPLRWFNHTLGELKKTINIELNSAQMDLVQILKKDIRRWKRFLPWKVKCFEEAIAAKKVLEKYKIKTTIYLGVAKNEEKNLIAHAWLKSGEVFISGEKGHKKHAVVGFYT